MGTVLIQANRETTVGVVSNKTSLVSTQRGISVVLWLVQAVLALLFLGSGGMKLVVPPEVLATMSPLPILFMKFIGLAEVLGGIGLILPALLRIRPALTPLAAACLAIEMIGATMTTIAIGGGLTALMPLVVGFLAAFVAYGRCNLAPQTARSGRSHAAARANLLASREC